MLAIVSVADVELVIGWTELTLMSESHLAFKG
jgi:hypothetical protein